jgi:hypothetical protein
MSEQFGWAQWKQYPFWARGPARIVGEADEAEVVLDEGRAERYYMYGPVALSFELAYLDSDLNTLNTDSLLAFVRRYGLLWHGAEDVGTGKCRERLIDMWVESRTLALMMRMYIDMRDALNTGATDPLRQTMSEFLIAFEANPPMDDDEELIDQASVYLAEALNIKLEDCRAGVASSTQLDVQPKGPDRFMLSHISPDLLTAAYAHFARTIVDRAPIRECPGCGRRFTPQSGKQKYHDKSCASTTRWRRWKDRQDDK